MPLQIFVKTVWTLSSIVLIDILFNLYFMCLYLVLYSLVSVFFRTVKKEVGLKSFFHNRRSKRQCDILEKVFFMFVNIRF